MNDERFEELMRDAAVTYRKVPSADFESMWNAVEGRMAKSEERDNLAALPSPAIRHSRFALRAPQILAIAATLVIGVALGRASMSLGSAPSAPAAVQKVAMANTSEPQPYEAETSKYLGQTAALLIALPSEVRAGRADEQFVGRAGELLSRTRLLLDSPAANDPQMRNLLEDLELVLAQVVRLQNNATDRTELDLINRALEQRDVIPRLRTAVADISAN
jgi:hypothetical protein